MLATKDYAHFAVQFPDGQQLLVDGADAVDKALPGDSVDVVAGAVKLRNRCVQPLLVGVVELTSKYRYGFTSRNVPIYLCKPYDESYPPFLTGCSERDVSKNIVVLFQFDNWQSTAKYPRGNIVRVIGTVGDRNVELEALLYRYAPYRHKKDIKLVLPNPQKGEVIDWPNTINIDPKGCVDIDDCISWRKVDNGLQIAISIADVAAFVEEDSIIDRTAAQIGQSLYQPTNTLHMMPAAVISAASLAAEGIVRPAVSLIFTIDTNNNIRDLRMTETMLVNRQTFDYDSIADSIHATILHQIANHIKPSNDSHEWIETFMIFYNSEAAKILRSRGEGLLRAHEPAIANTLPDDLKFLGYSAGTYILPTAAIVSHSGLGLPMYCHSTSPLRRYADLVNQRALKRAIRGAVTVPPDPRLAVTLNILQKSAKNHDRDVAFVMAMNSRIGIVNAIVIDHIKTDYIKIKLYVPDWKTIVSVRCESLPAINSPVRIEYYCDLHARAWKKRMVMKILP